MVDNTSATPATGANQTFNGTNGVDSLSGGGGSDTIIGGNGNDALAGDGPLSGQWQFAFYNRDFSSADGQAGTITSGTLVNSGYIDEVTPDTLANTLRGTTGDPNDYGFVLSSTLNVTTGGTYRFTTTSDDGSRIVIRDANGNVLNWSNDTGGTLPYMNNDFHQPPTTRGGSVTLPPGTYTVEILFWENAGGTALTTTIQGPDTGGTATNLLTYGGLGVPPTVPGQVDGNDSIDAGAGNDTVFGNGGNDTLIGGTGNDSMFGGDGTDSLFGGGDLDTLDGGDGNDVLDGGAASDTLIGGAGNDSLIGGAGSTSADQLSGGTGNDTLDGGGGNDTLDGGEDQDSLLGGDGTDSLLGGGGNDIIDGGAGGDNASGGAGADQIFGGTDASGDTLSGDAGNDTIDGGGGNDQIDGGADDDSLTGGLGNDTVAGGTGNDVITDTDGANQIDGGTGNDTISVTGNPGANAVQGGDGNDSITVFNGVGAVSTLDGGLGDDTIRGGDATDSILGGDGNDSILSGNGIDTVFGGAGNDFIDGFGGNDVLSGGIGNDTFLGGIGDTATGGEDVGNADIDVLDLFNAGWTKDTTNIIYGGGNNESGTVQFLDGNGAVIGSMTFSQIEKVVPCFTPGTMILTPAGERPVESLRAGDMVVTADRGPQPLRWIGRRDLDAAEMAAHPNLRPVRIAKGSLGGGLPVRDLWVSPQHRMVLSGWRARLYAGIGEGFAPAVMLTGRPGITREAPAALSYLHLLFDGHEVVFANGTATESLLPSARAIGGFAEAARAEVLTLFPELAATGPTGPYPLARPALRRHEAQLVLAG